MGDKYIIIADKKRVDEWDRAARWTKNVRITGCSFKNGPEGMSAAVATPQQTTTQRSPSPSAFPVRITGSTQDGSNLRWKYSWVEVEKSASGYGGWTTLVGGRGGTANLFNGTENMNGATGLMGNGVTLPISGTTFTLLPAPTGVVVRAVQVTLGDGTIEYWFNYENGVGGGCS